MPPTWKKPQTDVVPVPSRAQSPKVPVGSPRRVYSPRPKVATTFGEISPRNASGIKSNVFLLRKKEDEHSSLVEADSSSYLANQRLSLGKECVTAQMSENQVPIVPMERGPVGFQTYDQPFMMLQ